MIFLAGDIGGTHTRLLLGETRDSGWRSLALADYPSDQFDRFESLLRLFLETEPYRPQAMVLAVAGPIVAQRVRVTNLPWELDAGRLAAEFAIPHVRLLNDFEAQGHALAELAPDDVHVLQQGEADDEAPRAVLGAGTGLGMAIVRRCGAHWQVIPGEGGHTDFAPRNAAELALWQDLHQQAGRVSNEMVLSGPGLERIYRHLCLRQGVEPRQEGAAAISRAALDGQDPQAEAGLRMFVAIYGAVAGNLALLCLARGGVYLGGGIAPQILPALEGGDFLAAFGDKAPMQTLLQRLPVSVILAPDAGLRGAAALALQILEVG